MFRDFIYMDIDRIQSIIAQLQEGLLNEVMEGKTEQTTVRAQMAMNLLALMLPFSASGSVEHGRGTSISENKVLHNYVFEAARRSLEDEGLLLERDHLARDDVPEDGFVLIRGRAQILDYETLRNIAENVDKLDDFFNPSETSAQKKKRKTSEANRTIRESRVVMDTFFREAMRVKITNPQGCSFIGPLSREHLRENIRDMIYKYGSRSESERTMLAEVSRIPLVEDSIEEAIMQQLVEEGGSVSNQLDQVITMLNTFQEFLGSASYSDIAMSPIAVYREVGARAAD